MRAWPTSALALAGVIACGDGAGPAPEPLAVQTIDPADGAVDVPRSSDVVLTWSRPIDPGTVPQGILVAKDSSTLVATGSAVLDGGATRLTFRAGGGFGFNQWIRVLASDGAAGVRDRSGVGLATPFEAFFRTELATPVVAVDPVGDTLDTDTLFTERAADLVRLDVRHGVDTVSFLLTFSAPRVLDDANHPDFVRGLIDLDTDHDPTTGIETWVDFLLRVNGFPPITGMAEDYFIDFFEPRGGVALLVRWVTADSSAVAATLTPVVSGNTLRFDVPIAALGRTGGNVQVALFVATKTFVTDFLPDSGHVTFGHPGGTAARPASLARRGGVSGPLLLQIERRLPRR